MTHIMTTVCCYAGYTDMQIEVLQIMVQVNWITMPKNEYKAIFKSKMAARYHVGSEWYQIAYQSI